MGFAESLIRMDEGFSNSTIDTVATRYLYGQGKEDIREYLLELGLSEYDAFLCYCAALTLASAGFYAAKAKNAQGMRVGSFVPR